MIIAILTWLFVLLGAAAILAAIVLAFTLAHMGVRRAAEWVAMRSNRPPSFPQDYRPAPPVARRRRPF